MKAIVAVNKNWAIGKDGDLLYSLPTDMRFFRETTKGCAVVMGRKTLDSFPNGKPLKNRTNIVISTSNSTREDVIWVNSHVEAFKIALNYNESFLIGGASIYNLLIDYCDEAYVTVIDDDKEGDSYFPDLSKKENWILSETSDEITENGYTFRFCKYKNNYPKEV